MKNYSPGNYSGPSPSKYFNNYTFLRRQKTLEDIIIQAIKRFGVFVKYIPRESVIRDNLYGDDPYTKFETAVQVEVYPKDVMQFSGGGDILSRFSFMQDDQITFVIARKRWDQIRTEKLLMENDFNYQQEISSDSLIYDTNSFLLEDGNMEQYSINSERPLPGDLVYFPMVHKIFEITHVEHEALFYQHGKLMVYELQCQLFKASSEEFDTGHEEIDAFQTNYSLDENLKNILVEDGGDLLTEDGLAIVKEKVTPEDTDPAAQNDFFEQQGDKIINHGEKEPFTLDDDW